MALQLDRKPRRTWLWGTLVVSLAVNAFFVGAVLTEFVRFGHWGKSAPRAERMELRWLRDRLSPDAVGSIEASLMPLRPDILARIDRLKKLRAELGVLAAAQQPDRASIDTHLRDIRLEVGAMQEQIQSRTFESVLALTPEQRAPLATPSASD